MADTPPTSPNPFNPLRGDGHGAPPPPAQSKPISSPPVSASASPFGPIGQYKHAPPQRTYINEVSITGATVDDPSGSKTRLPVRDDPDWASPLRSMQLAARTYFFSMLAYWVAYNLTLAALLKAGTFLSQKNSGWADMIPSTLAFGPFLGLIFDSRIIISTSWLAIIGVVLVFVDQVVFFLFLFSTTWRGRLKAYGVLLAMLVFKLVIYALATQPGK